MTIHINLSPELEAYLKSKVESGFYGNVTEVIRAAVREMKSNDEEKENRLRRAIEKGMQSIKDGKADLWTPELADAIFQKAMSRTPEDIEYDPDVIPAKTDQPFG